MLTTAAITDDDVLFSTLVFELIAALLAACADTPSAHTLIDTLAPFINDCFGVLVKCVHTFRAEAKL